jgi:hypothetical protein
MDAKGGKDIMINETNLDGVIAELRVELDRIDRAIVVFEKLASQKKAPRRKSYRAAAARPRTSGSYHASQSSTPPS